MAQYSKVAGGQQKSYPFTGPGNAVSNNGAQSRGPMPSGGPGGGAGARKGGSGYPASQNSQGSASVSGSSGNSSAGRQRYGGSAMPFSRGGAAGAGAGAGAAQSSSNGSHDEHAGLLSNSGPAGGASYSSGAAGNVSGAYNRGGYTPAAPYSPYTSESSSSHSHGRSKSRGSSHAGSEAASRFAMGPQTYFSAAAQKDPEPDDFLHAPDGKGDRNHGVSCGGVLNIITLATLSLGLLMLFAGYPILSHFATSSDFLEKLGLGVGGTNGTGQIPQLPIRPLIDTATPPANQAWKNPQGTKYQLVFSDEFNEEGRTFWPGDDPYWTAVDIWYGATGDYEWYSPEAINTTGGNLVITMTAKETHNLNFQSGMLQSWNQLCYQGGYIEFNLMLPGGPSTSGYWPAAWLMGNLGRAGYLGSTDGQWPYSYSSCDTGILPNQTFLNASGPDEAINSKATYARKGQLSRLTGMRSSACTCPGEDHPGPNVNTARSAPEIDIIEAQIQTDRNTGTKHSYASQSLQVAPFDTEYYFHNKSTDYTLYDTDTTKINSYHGGVYQEAVSGVSLCPDSNFASTGNQFVTYGVEYEPDWDLNGGGYTRWFVNGKPTWEVMGSALAPRPELDVGQRHIPVEPMYIIMNLGMSSGFQYVDFDPTTGISLPAQMLVDYVRVYQLEGQDPKLSCDPPDHPTADYISRHPTIYQNPNITRYDKPWPLNKITAAAAGQSC